MRELNEQKIGEFCDAVRTANVHEQHERSDFHLPLVLRELPHEHNTSE